MIRMTRTTPARASLILLFVLQGLPPTALHAQNTGGQPFAEDAARAHRDGRLDRVVARAERVLGRVEQGEQALALGLVTMGFVLEGAQGLTTYRTPDWTDAAANLTGIAAGAWAGRRAVRERTEEQ